MAAKNKRSVKNYLIDRQFQYKFLLKFFIFSFVILTVGSTLQYQFANKTIRTKLSHINLELEERQKSMLVFLNNHKYLLEKDIKQLPLALQEKMSTTIESYNSFITDEVKFIEKQLKGTKTIVAADSKKSSSALWTSIFVAGIIMNIAFSFFYGIFLSHNFAGNHYRLQLFARQLQDKNLVAPLVVRKKDFFQETANELDTARIIIQQDLCSIRKNSDVSVLEKYKLEKNDLDKTNS